MSACSSNWSRHVHFDVKNRILDRLFTFLFFFLLCLSSFFPPVVSSLPVSYFTDFLLFLFLFFSFVQKFKAHQKTRVVIIFNQSEVDQLWFTVMSYFFQCFPGWHSISTEIRSTNWRCRWKGRDKKRSSQTLTRIPKLTQMSTAFYTSRKKCPHTNYMSTLAGKDSEYQQATLAFLSVHKNVDQSPG